MGNEDEIFSQARALVEQTEDAGQRARVFAIGTGSSVNRHLLTSLAEAGKGQSEVITLSEDPDRAVEMVFRAIDAPSCGTWRWTGAASPSRTSCPPTSATCWRPGPSSCTPATPRPGPAPSV
ncbi:MAG: hypothetical protein R3F43_25050 [bacterium]